ncbi:hypothetical protein JHK82_034083 [Glycine max]|nr:hypothetical protein JHK82_034083 [Glycine max]KAG5140650.1 hypothetical protein JHK84_034418 [Glycine max]
MSTTSLTMAELASSLLPPHSSTPKPNPLSLQPPPPPSNPSHSNFHASTPQSLSPSPHKLTILPFWEPNGEDVGEDNFDEPPEVAKLFVGNLPYEVDSQKLAMLFEQAETIEIVEVIYNRETNQSRGFGFVTMSTV